jgi:hypothetical protein
MGDNTKTSSDNLIELENTLGHPKEVCSLKALSRGYEDQDCLMSAAFYLTCAAAFDIELRGDIEIADKLAKAALGLLGIIQQS